MIKLMTELATLITHLSLVLFNQINFWVMVLVLSVVLTMIMVVVIMSCEYFTNDKLATRLMLFAKGDPKGMWPFKFLAIVFLIWVIDYLVVFILSFWYVMVMTLLHVNLIGHGWMALLFSMAMIAMVGNLLMRKSIRLRIVMTISLMMSVSGMLIVLGLSNLH